MTRVLGVDDNAINLYLLRAILQGHGYEVDEARNGADALARARQNPPDLIISDLLMPVLDGYSLLRQWRADDRLKTVPFIVYTATYTEPKDQRLAMALGADAFIVKPASPDALIDAVGDVLDRNRRGERPPALEHPLDEHVLLREYNEVLVRKLEKKVLEAAQTNRELLDEIAERKHAEEKLRHSEERFRATFERAAVGIAHVGADGQFAWVNDKLCGMTGYSSDELRHLTFIELTAPEDRSEGDDARRAMLAGAQSVYSAEKRYVRKDGGTFWGNVVTTLLHDDGMTGPHYFVSVIIDITDRKKLEDQLRQSQKMEAVGRLAGGVAHDFNNLLTIINGCSEMLMAVPEVSNKDRELVTAISEAGDRAAALTRQLLGFSRQTILQPRVIDLNALVTETEKMLRRLLGEDISLATVLSGDLARVKVDPGQMDQVLMNLAVNARDAMPTGGHLTIETSNVLLGERDAIPHLNCQAGPHVMLAISDTGCGMGPALTARIFEPFFTTKGADKGTGLGLSMVLGTVQQSGGCVHVYSEPGHGTTFKIYLPAVVAPVIAAIESVPESKAHGAETVLIVEDEIGVRALATRILEKYGYTVLAATDGHDAMERAEAHTGTIDLVLTDVVMPDISGPEVAKNLKARFPRMKVLFMSGYTDDAVVRHGLIEAEVAFIQKPYTALGLAQRVRQVLDQDQRALSS